MIKVDEENKRWATPRTSLLYSIDINLPMQHKLLNWKDEVSHCSSSGSKKTQESKKRSADVFASQTVGYTARVFFCVRFSAALVRRVLTSHLFTISTLCRAKIRWYSKGPFLRHQTMGFILLSCIHRALHEALLLTDCRNKMLSASLSSSSKDKFES